MAEAVGKPKEKGDSATSPWQSWEAVLADPNLRGVPYKMETNERGQIVVSPPAAPKHGGRQISIGRLLEKHLSGGKSVAECPVRTPGGTKAPDVVWFSERRWDEARDATGDSPVAPEICVEILSPSNTEAEMAEKRALYFEAGAEEVWLCDEDGQMHFFGRGGEQDTSQRAPDFPEQVDV